MLPQIIKKIKDWIEENKSDLYVAALIFLVGLGSFGLGRLSILWPQREPITIEPSTHYNTEKIQSNIEIPHESALSPQRSTPGKYVASKHGAVYHFPWCPGALKIKEENKIWFNTKEEAERKGYRPAANCEGL